MQMWCAALHCAHTIISRSAKMKESADTATPKHTPLFALHNELGGKMVPFAGYAMPVQYPRGIIKEHTHTRNAAGLFDVSHMGQVRLSGPNAAAALESILPVDVIGLKPGRQRYAMFTNDAGGILDDLMVARMGDDLILVVNAACKDADIAHLKSNLSDQCEITVLEDRGLLALQGPQAADVLARLNPEVTTMKFMDMRELNLDGFDCVVSRSGYTGEDGYEISVSANQADALARRLLSESEVEAIGLGARDSLRLEGGLCLYGHDIDTDTTPVEAGLNWALSKARRTGGARPGGYPGADVIMKQLEQGASRKRVGIKPEGRAPLREGVELFDADDKLVGKITSGGFGPTVNGPVAMAYVDSDHQETGTILYALVRGKPVKATVVVMPFVKANYFRG